MISSDAGYAAALFKASQQCGFTEQVAEDLAVVEQLLSSCARFFNNPEVKAKKKADLLSEALKGSANELTVQFIVLLAMRKRLKRLPVIRRHFDKLADSALGRSSVCIRTPYELSEATLRRLLAYISVKGLISNVDSDKLKVDIVIDKSLIGGFIAESEGRILDTSLKARLIDLHRIHV